eukprot:355593-Chlamydomonas_euryale.AAC.2
MGGPGGPGMPPGNFDFSALQKALDVSLSRRCFSAWRPASKDTATKGIGHTCRPAPLSPHHAALRELPAGLYRSAARFLA